MYKTYSDIENTSLTSSEADVLPWLLMHFFCAF